MDGFTNIEGNISFVFGFIALYYFFKREKLLFLLSLIGILLTLKRIVLLSLFVVIICYLLPKGLKKIVLNKYLIISLNALVVLFSIFLAQGYWDEMIWNYFGISPEFLTMGRTRIYDTVLRVIDFNDLKIWMLGTGQGNTTNILFASGTEDLLHNDILKLFLEHGIIIWGLFMFFLYKFSKGLQVYVTLFYNILLLTDNILIYPICYFLYLLIYLSFSENDKIKGLR
ncbi:O-antigen ligase family protein [Carboxylicivirga sediminis]|uniref:O-antigen ligase family protein n=1 Tax=Carboxylicivirga sediminis TaxID=2006564 RepID=A0A941F8A0_9BACT|nr:O-antigen ligase family protein [Carboxylicivirga sediminis]MBR8537379.1 O-antigen ligase family protein [Carboxylicivirga sediminis]